MTTAPPNVEAALASLRERWGSAAPRWGAEVVGALAIAPIGADDEPAVSTPGGRLSGAPSDARPNRSTRGRSQPASVRWTRSSGWAVCRAPRPPPSTATGPAARRRWRFGPWPRLRPRAGSPPTWTWPGASIRSRRSLGACSSTGWSSSRRTRSSEAMAMAAMLLQDRTVDLLLLDLPNRPLDGAGISAANSGRAVRPADGARSSGRRPADRPRAAEPSLRPGGRADPGRRAAAGAEPAGVDPAGARRGGTADGGPCGRGTGSGRRVGRRSLRILYAEGGLRDACLARDELLRETAESVRRHGRAWSRRRAGSSPESLRPGRPGRPLHRGCPAVAAPPPHRLFPVSTDATSPSPLAPPTSPSGPQPVLHALRGGADRPGRQALDERPGPGREPLGARAGRPARDAAGGGSPARP